MLRHVSVLGAGFAVDYAAAQNYGTVTGIEGKFFLERGIFATAALAQVRRPENAPPARVLGVPAWTLATAGFIKLVAQAG